MNFYQYRTLFELSRSQGKVNRSVKWEEFYNSAYTMLQQMHVHRGTINHVVAEIKWYTLGRPYYNLWPSIIPMFQKLNLECDSGEIKPPLETLLIKLPYDNILNFVYESQKYTVQSIMMSSGNIGNAPGLLAWIDIDEWVSETDLSYTYATIQTITGKSVEDSLRNLPKSPTAKIGVQIPENVIHDCIRLCCCVCLLAHDDEIIEPEVLTADMAKFESTRDTKYIEKAKKRGKFGWNIGRQIEMVPHYRRPHLALVWTGRGRTIPKIVMRKGSLIHRETVKKIPTNWEE